MGRSDVAGAERLARLGAAARLALGAVACGVLVACGAPGRYPSGTDGSAAASFNTVVWPANGPTVARFDGRSNRGIDIGGNPGDPVVAVAPGRVVYAGNGLRGYGNMVILKHNNTYLTAYAHNRRLLVREGDEVRAGQQIAEMGSTDADSTKLHFEVRRAGVAVDPQPYLQAARQQQGATRAAGGVAGPDDEVPPARGKATGSGFAITGNLVVTNAHVVSQCKKVEVVDRGEGRVRASDVRNDLALIELTSVSAPDATLSQTRLRQGDAVTVIGFPLRGLLASGPQVTAGNATALAGIANNTGVIQISAPVQPGNSGGPVLDASGNVVAVVTSKLNVLRAAAVTGDFAQNINFAVSLATLKGFLDANEVNYRTAPSTKSLGTADVADIGRRFTVLVECTR